MKFLQTPFFIWLLFIFFISCNDANIDGTACSYNTDVLPAEVIAIEKRDSLNADILFRIKDETGEVLKDSVSWFMQNKGYVPLQQLVNDNITVGTICSFEIMTIVNGHCNPYIQTLKLDKFK